MNLRHFSALALGSVALTLVSCSSVSVQAPAAMPAGKTLHFDHSTAEHFNKGSDSETWQRDVSPNPLLTLSLSARPNTQRNQFSGVGEGHFLAREHHSDGTTGNVSFDYRKTAADTVEIELPGFEWGTTYTLRFETPTSGTAAYNGCGEGEEWKGNGIKFNLK